MKRLLVVALVAVVLFTGIPVVMGMPAACVDCDLGVTLVTSCVFGVLTAAVGAALVLLSLQLSTRARLLASLLATSGLDRPPRPV